MAKKPERNPPIYLDGFVRFDVSTEAHPDTWALVDTDDWLLIRSYRWSATRRPNGLYVRSSALGLLHRHIVKPNGDLVVDHRNGDPLDNRRSNLRECTQTFNNQAGADRRRGGYAIIIERTPIPTKKHVVKMTLATGEVRSYEYPSRSKKGTKDIVARKILPGR